MPEDGHLTMSAGPLEKAIDFLDSNSIEYERFDHPAVFTVDQVTELVQIHKGHRTKNLFVRDKKGRRHVLIVVPHDKRVDLMALGEVTGHGRVSFASPERLMTHLGVEPGSVTIMGIINDTGNNVELVIDTSVWNADFVRCHPLVNTSTVILPAEGIRTMLRLTGHEPTILDVPAR